MATTHAKNVSIKRVKNDMIKAMKQALEALERSSPAMSRDFPAHGEAITALRQAIKQAEKQEQGEPVAWMYPDDLKRFETSETFAQAYSIEMVSPTQGETVPLYTTPQPRKPLTNEQITEIYTKWESTKGTSWADLMRAVEAAHGIKE